MLSLAMVGVFTSDGPVCFQLLGILIGLILRFYWAVLVVPGGSS